MKIKNVSKTDLYSALNKVNQKYDNNVTFNDITQYGKYFNVTLKVINANKKNGTIKGRKLNQSFLTYGKGIRANGSACWHVHGDFFDALLNVNPKAVIITQMSKVFKDEHGVTQGNWTDRNISSLMNPILYSEACECNQLIPQTVTSMKVPTMRTVLQSHLSSECWMIQLRGLTACDHCELRSTLDCGGKQIRVSGKNSLGYTVPI